MGVRKSKWILAGFLFVAGLFVSIWLSAAVTGFVEREIQDFAELKSLSFGAAMAMLKSNDKCAMLFLCCQGLVSLLLVILVMNKKTSQYESAMRRITPDIKTPVAAGQKQHGSAEWLRRDEYKTAFGSYILNPGDPQIKELIKHGYDDLEFMKPKKGSVRGGDRSEN